MVMDPNSTGMNEQLEELTIMFDTKGPVILRREVPRGSGCPIHANKRCCTTYLYLLYPTEQNGMQERIRTEGKYSRGTFQAVDEPSRFVGKGKYK
uniref:Uncharacterized protein n=1 Tax=Romanomermis culicivorax TaxID=13658 RepID=A0A915HI06_ROMCU